MEIIEGFELSPQQKHLWRLQYFSQNLPYRAQGTVQIKGKIDANTLKAAIEQVISNHEILRTTFNCVPGMTLPLQVIAPDCAFNFSEYDYKEIELEAQLAQMELLWKHYNQVPFEFSQNLLFHCSLVTLSEEESVLFLNLPALYMDIKGFDNLVLKISNSYRACLKGEQIFDEVLQYPDISEWQNQLLDDEEQELILAKGYWRKQNITDSLSIKLPFERQFDGETEFDPRYLNFTVTPSQLEEISEFIQKEKSSIDVFFLACWQVLLWRITQQSKVVVGVGCEGRKYEEIRDTIGLLARYLPLKYSFKERLLFQDVLKETQIELNSIYTWQERFSWEFLNHENQNHVNNSFFAYSFDFTKLDQHLVDDICFSIVKHDICFDKFKVKLSLTHSQYGLEAQLYYDAKLFDEDYIQCLAEQFQTLLSSVLDCPETVIDKIEIISKLQQEKILVNFNDTSYDYPKDKCIHQLFEEQVEKTPNAVALVFEEQQLTYRQLNQKANQLAHHLFSKGVRSEVLVGICVERSVEMVVGLLGILKAGGAYLPLDPNYPLERLSYMLEDSQLPILLTQQRLLKQLPQHQAQTICLDEDWQNFADYSQDNPCGEVKPDNLAYIIYTSGSTGKPKGTMILHRGMVNYLSWCTKAYNIAAGVGSTVNSSISFDATITSLFSPLLVGGWVVLLPEKGEIEALKAALCSGTKFSLVKITPAHLEILSHLFAKEEIKIQTQAFIIGGEALSEKVTSFWQKHAPATRLINEYGPTETVVGCCIYEVEKLCFSGGNIPIGRPIANTQIYILDSHHQPVPIGVPGELYIGGDGLARGYLNRPELTSEKFIPNPFSNSKSERLYKTGDLARHLSDGNIEFLGRIDHQVKIRGFRIELGEIEAVLNTHPQIQQAVVIATDNIPGNKGLVAYVVPTDQSLTTNQLREFLKHKLPEYMVPSAFVTLDTLPLTPNGKIDRKALSTYDGEIMRETIKVTPRTPTEEIIANTFALVLGVQNVGIHDNFFSLGGHSLLATQLISRLRLGFAVEIPLRTVFESPTVTQLDQSITQLRTVDRGLTLPPIQPIEGDTELLPLSWAQERLWFLNQLEGSTATYNIPAAVRITGNLDLKALQQTLSEIVHRHSVLRTSIQTVNGTPRQVIHPEATMNINVVDLQQSRAQERETLQKQLAFEEAITPFDLEIAPLIRCSCVQLSATEYVLLLTMHHIVSDGWSMGVFISELSALYQANCDGVPSPLPELPMQYVDFAVWQRQWLSGVVLDTQLNYWRTQLHGAPSLLQLPTDRPRPVVQTYQGKTHSFTVLGDLTQKLQSLSSESGTTLFMTLLATFATLLYRYSGQSDILIGSPIANRNRSEIESLIGFFVNTLVLRTSFEANPSFENLLAQVRETTLKAYEHQDVPFEQVVEALQPQRCLAYSPLFQVMFVWQNAPMGEVELPGVTLTQLDQESTIAKFDLTLSMSETDQGLVGEWEYNTDLYDGETIERMAGHFQNLLSAIVENPAAAVGELPLLSEVERHQLLREWNDTESVYPTDKCIHQLFEQQVQKTPHSVAVVFENQQLTYLQLNQRANQLAHHLLSLGVGPEVLVGICVERSIEMLVGLLGILKAGGAYVPLDPEYPQERLAYMLNDSQVPVLLTQTHLLDLLPAHEQVICLDTDLLLISSQSESNPISDVKSSNLAYVIYTSGSTGQPKGTMILHQGVVNYLTWCTKAYTLSEGTGAPVQSSIAFDATITSLFSPLLVGQKVVLLPQKQEMEALSAVLSSQSDFSLVKLTPAHLEVLAQLLPAQIAAKPTKALVIGGEALLGKSLSFWHNYAPNTRLFNEYGPTETVVGCCVYEVTQTTSLSQGIPIGRPIANTQLYILDQFGQPVPLGVSGELYIGGDGLARGYLNRPELTSEKFIPNPFSNSKSERLYKTGDLARYKRDSNIEFLGRIDQQVKVRGFRIELGEIEAVLSQHPCIHSAVVIAREETTGDKCLVAYIVPQLEVTPTSSELRQFLKAKLPEYMVPNAFVILEALPLTANGKVDRRALPAPDVHSQQLDKYVAPRTPTEELLAQIWTQVLKVDQVGIHDNFFDLGGHSLLATQLLSRLRYAFQVKLPLSSLFEATTIAELAELIEEMLIEKIEELTEEEVLQLV